MSTKDDLERLAAQEAELVFDRFDENVAFSIGQRVRDAALARGAGVSVLIKLWDRPVFFSATPGTSFHNYKWCHRKANTVEFTHKSTYRHVLERDDKPRVFEESWGVDAADYVFAGGAVPINVKGIGIVGATVASGLDERADHEIVVEAMCAELGLDFTKLALD